MSKVNSISSTICLNSMKASTSGQEEKMIDLKTKESMIDLTSANKTAIGQIVTYTETKQFNSYSCRSGFFHKKIHFWQTESTNGIREGP